MSDGLIKWSLNAKYDSLTHHAHILQADAAMAGQHGALQRMLEDFIIVKTFIVSVLGQVTSIYPLTHNQKSIFACCIQIQQC